MLKVRNEVPRNDVLLGIVRAERVATDRYPERFDQMLRSLLAVRSKRLGEAEEARRAAARDMLRNGSYKPTGRGKPASEYLLRAARETEYTFPRVNSPVDVCNYLSLKHVVPISLWDLDRAGTERYVFRLGLPGEGVVFNEAGQRIDVEDLLVGCRVSGGDDLSEEPIINPVRDSLATKTTPQTRRVAACVYAPSNVIDDASLASICEEFARLLSQCGEHVEAAHGSASPDKAVEV